MITLTRKKLTFLSMITLLVITGVILGTMAMTPANMTMSHSSEKHSMEHNMEIVTETQDGIKHLLAEGRYKCCLEKPCSYCFSDPDHQKEELVCDCLVDIMNGEHPCGECIGEILEGHGNPLIAEYFATAIAEKVGEQHLDTLQKIVAEKYSMPANKQI